MTLRLRKYVLDTNCFIDAATDYAFRREFARFCEAAAPQLFLSAVVAAELRAGLGDKRMGSRLDAEVVAPYARRGRVLTPSAQSWEALGTILGTLAARDGLRADQAPRSFAFDVLIALSCREAGAVLVSRNTRDLARIARITPFEFVAPFPELR